MNNQNNNYNGNYNRNYNGQYNNMNNGQYYNNGQYPQNYNNNQYYNNRQQQYYNQYPQNNQQQQQPVNNNTAQKVKVKKEEPKQKLSMNVIIAIIALVVIIAVTAVIIINHNSSDGPEEEEVIADTRVVGNKTLGYVTIPIDWLKFQDVEDVRGLQYSDKDGNYILTLDAVITSSLDAREFIDQKKAELAASNIEVQETIKTISGYSAYQISGYYEAKGLWLMVWCFEAEDGYTHYIGVEGIDKENEAFQIPETFSLDEK